ncbi:MAG: SAM-dependent methyltransferase [Phycisphaerae bacterium]
MNAAQCSLDAGVSVEKLAGHVFLARMGKKLLRPGGRRATEQLFELAGLEPGQRVCEIATNRAVTAIELAERFGVRVDGVDASPEFLALARDNIAAHALADRIQVHVGKGHELPFEDNTFDRVTAEAVVTMLPPEQKLATLREAARVLRPGGCLVIHELAWSQSDKAIRADLVKTIQHAAWPMTDDEWRSILAQAGLSFADSRTGEMSLMSPTGLLRDEGVGGVVRILWNILRTPGARTRFKSMARFFRLHREGFHYIVLKATKSGD